MAFVLNVVGATVCGAVALLPWYWLVRILWRDWREGR